MTELLKQNLATRRRKVNTSMQIINSWREGKREKGRGRKHCVVSLKGPVHIGSDPPH